MVFPPGAAESEGPDGFLFDRADRKSQDLGDLGLGKAIDTVQEEDLLSPWGQRFERGEQGMQPLTGINHVIREGLVLDVLFRKGCPRVRVADPLSPEMVQCQILGGPEQQTMVGRTKRSIVQFDEHILRDILGDRAIADDTMD
jgi:hypothetical protein